jgi:hypothetical protein
LAIYHCGDHLLRGSQVHVPQRRVMEPETWRSTKQQIPKLRISRRRYVDFTFSFYVKVVEYLLQLGSKSLLGVFYLNPSMLEYPTLQLYLFCMGVKLGFSHKVKNVPLGLKLCIFVYILWHRHTILEHF